MQNGALCWRFVFKNLIYYSTQMPRIEHWSALVASRRAATTRLPPSLPSAIGQLLDRAARASITASLPSHKRPGICSHQNDYSPSTSKGIEHYNTMSVDYRWQGLSQEQKNEKFGDLIPRQGGRLPASKHGGRVHPPRFLQVQTLRVRWPSCGPKIAIADLCKVSD